MIKFSKVIARKRLPPRYYYKIANVIVEWCWLEYRLQESIWYLLGRGKANGRILTAEMAPSELTVLLKALAPRLIKDQQLSTQVIALANEIEKTAKHRNNLAHGFWAFNSSMARPTMYRYVGAQRVTGKTPDYSLPKIEEAAKTIRDLRDQLETLMARA
jgi:DNA-binding IclR family transcriptional regulator